MRICKVTELSEDAESLLDESTDGQISKDTRYIKRLYSCAID